MRSSRTSWRGSWRRSRMPRGSGPWSSGARRRGKPAGHPSPPTPRWVITGGCLSCMRVAASRPGEGCGPGARGRRRRSGRTGRVDAAAMARAAQRRAEAGIVESRVRSALAREFGVRWVRRAEGRGYEIGGIPQRVLDAYSPRTQKVPQKAALLAREWEAKYGRVPNAREMLFITDEANLASRHGKDDAQIDWNKLARKWDRTIGGELAGLTEVCDFRASPG